jgi:hypothetical protein
MPDFSSSSFFTLPRAAILCLPTGSALLPELETFGHLHSQYLTFNTVANPLSLLGLTDSVHHDNGLVSLHTLSSIGFLPCIKAQANHGTKFCMIGSLYFLPSIVANIWRPSPLALALPVKHIGIRLWSRSQL